MEEKIKEKKIPISALTTFGLTGISFIAVREACPSRHNGGPGEGTPCTPQYHSTVMVARGSKGP